MKNRFLVLSIVVLAPWALAAPRVSKRTPKQAKATPKPALKPSVAQLRAAYATKVRKIEDRLTMPLIEISIADPEKESGAMLDRRAGVTKALADLSAISPVPRSLASVDATYGRFAVEAQSALGMIFDGLKRKDLAPVVAGQHRLSDSLAIMTRADKELERLTAPAQQGKKYVDG